MTDGGNDTIGQVRVDVAELKGMITAVITDHGRRLTENESATRQLRTDLTAVNDNINLRINTLVAEGSAKGSLIETTVAKHESQIADVKSDVAILSDKHNSLGTRMATYIMPLIAIAALVATIYFNHH